MTEGVSVARDAATAAVAKRERIRARCAHLIPQLRPHVATGSPDAGAMFRLAFEELSAVDPENTCSELIECLFLVTNYYFLAAQPTAGLASATTAVEHASHLGDMRLARRALSMLGGMFIETGNLTGATEALSEALHVARSLDDPSVEAPIWNNIGSALQSAAQYGDALRCFERAAARARSSNSALAGAEKNAYINITSCALHLHDVRTGIRAVRKAIELNPDPTTADDCLLRVLAESHYARLLMEVGELGHAEEHARSAREYADKAPTARAEYSASMTSGLIEVHCNRRDIGLTRLKRSLELARKSVKSEVRDALSACIAGYEAAGQPDVALVYLHELLAMNREGRAARLLAPFEALAAELGSGQDSDLRFDQVMTSKAIDLTGRIAKCVGDLVTAAIDNALRAGHDAQRIFRVGRLAELFVLSLGWKEEAAGELALAVRLMDVGSVVVPDELLRKSRALSAGERKLVAEHTGFGAELLQRARLALLQPCVPLAKFHHERWDGTGPWGLAGEGIPVAARIAALADALDALTHARPWRPAVTLPAAVRVMRDEAGSRFDPALAERFVRFVKELFWDHDNLDDYLAGPARDSEYLRTRAQLRRLLESE